MSQLGRPSLWIALSIVVGNAAAITAQQQIDLEPKASASSNGAAASSNGAAAQDSQIQGEYGGELTGEYRSRRLGWQVIALGEGRFRGVEFAGGLPGDGWKGKSRGEYDGHRQGRFVVFPGDGSRSILLIPFRQEIWLRDPVNGAMLGLLRKVERFSPTLDAPPPAGAIVLFDGRSVQNFDKAHLTQDGLLAVGAVTRRAVRDFFLHLEFQTPYMPAARDQARGNSGVYVQRRYEVQILDSFGLKGESNECGGLYKQRRPDVNLCLPPLAWQTYDVDFRAAGFNQTQKVRNARMTVLHNGVTIHRNVELTGPTGAGQAEGPDPQPILLQDHGNPVRFRNIWLIERSRD